MNALRQVALRAQWSAFKATDPPGAAGTLILAFDHAELARGDDTSTCMVGPDTVPVPVAAALLRAVADQLDPKGTAPPVKVRHAPLDAEDLVGVGAPPWAQS